MHFTITQSCGTKKYLTSLVFRELTLIRCKQPEGSTSKLCFLPKCLTLISKKPIFSIQKQMLLVIYEEIVIKFHTEFAELYRPSDDYRELDEKIYRAKRKIKIEQMEFFLTIFFHHLTMDGSNLEVELFKTVEVGSNIRAKQSLLKYINSGNKECLRLENYDFKLLFQKVKPATLLHMFISLLHERKIILIHNNSGDNATLIECLISLMYPLEWNFTNISYLIPSMLDYLDAPFPYIVGVTREVWK